jgi:hypothetical protein
VSRALYKVDNPLQETREKDTFASGRAPRVNVENQGMNSGREKCPLTLLESQEGSAGFTQLLAGITRPPTWATTSQGPSERCDMQHVM